MFRFSLVVAALLGGGLLLPRHCRAAPADQAAGKLAWTAPCRLECADSSPLLVVEESSSSISFRCAGGTASMKAPLRMFSAPECGRLRDRFASAAPWFNSLSARRAQEAFLLRAISRSSKGAPVVGDLDNKLRWTAGAKNLRAGAGVSDVKAQLDEFFIGREPGGARPAAVSPPAARPEAAQAQAAAAGAAASGLKPAEPPLILPPVQYNPSLLRKCKYFFGFAYSCGDDPGVKYQKVPGSLFVKGEAPQPADVKQGTIGDCYFMASLGAIANKHPDKIREMIRENKDGTFSVTFYHRRKPGEIWKPEFLRVVERVDGKFPVKHGLVYARYGRSSQGFKEIWPVVAEKAYAAFLGGFDRIGDGGNPALALEHLTGRPSQSFNGADVTMDSLGAWYDAGRAIVAGTKVDSGWPVSGSIWGEPLFRTRRLVPEHAYWVESVDRKRKIVTLANPWGWGVVRVALSEAEFQRVIEGVYVNPVR